MRTVWIVDDDEEMVRAVQLMLRLLNCDTSFFLTARTAAKAFMGGKRPDLLVLDINMPGVTGMDMLEYLRQKLKLKDLPIVILSSEAADVQVDQALEMGADAYITKPVSVEELDSAMRKALLAHGIS